MKTVEAKSVFSSYEIFIIAILAILQFTVILDFMVLSPLGAILLEELTINPAQFGLVVSAYAFSAGASGILAAGFADRYDRKKLLLFFYTGFILGTFCCALAPTYEILLAARIVTGLFGGVISSVSLAIISDIFKQEVRGRVMSFVQMGFAASQILGIPIGLSLANLYGWHAPFWMIAIFGTLVGVAIFLYMRPVNDHLTVKQVRNPLQHLANTLTHKHYPLAFLATTLLATGGFMLMPFGSAFTIHNIGLTMEQLPYVYGVTGIFSIMMGPLIGKLSDRIGKYKTFCIGSAITMVMVYIYTNLGISTIGIVILVNVILFMGILSRSISATALNTAVPDLADRGAFMSINSAAQQISGGIAAAIAGLIVVQTKEGKLLHYDTGGYVVIGTVLLSVVLLYSINQYVLTKNKKTTTTLSNDTASIQDQL